MQSEWTSGTDAPKQFGACFATHDCLADFFQALLVRLLAQPRGQALRRVRAEPRFGLAPQHSPLPIETLPNASLHAPFDTPLDTPLDALLDALANPRLRPATYALFQCHLYVLQSQLRSAPPTAGRTGTSDSFTPPALDLPTTLAHSHDAPILFHPTAPRRSATLR